MFTAIVLSFMLFGATFLSLIAGSVLTLLVGLNPIKQPYAVIWFTVIAATAWFLWNMMNKVERAVKEDFDFSYAHWNADSIRTARILIVVTVTVWYASAAWIAHAIKALPAFSFFG